MYNQTNNVNIKPKSYLPEFHVSQNDIGRTLTAHLVSDDGDVTIPAGATVTMAGTKPSGLGYTVTGTIDGSDVSFDTDAVMTDEPGRIVSEIRIVQGDTLIGTTNVVLSIEPNPHPDDTTDGRREPLINEITALLESITEQADRAEAVTKAVIDMTVTAHESDEATVTKTEGEVVNLDFGLPRGPQGIQGVPGRDGADGVTPDFSIGTVETLAPGERATATITGTEEDPVLNLGIPQGAKGDKGDPGEVSLETLAKVMVSDTASGTIASFTDGSDVLPAKSVLVTLAPKQSGTGTPSPSNIRPISGWDEVETVVSGVNLVDYGSMQEGYINDQGGVTAWSPTSQERYSDYIEIKGGQPYIFSATVSNSSQKWVGIGIYDENKAFIKRVANTLGSVTDFSLSLTESDTDGAKYVRVSFRTYGIATNVQFEVGSIATDYVPYTAPTTYTTDLPQTVYGGTLDVVSGVLTVTHAIKDMGDVEWIYALLNGVGSFYVYWNDAKLPSSNSVKANMIASAYQIDTANNIYTDTSSGRMSLNTRGAVQIRNSNYSDATAFTNAMSGQTICYELATPTTIQCDPQTVQTLIGDNNVWGGSGVSIDYYADTKLYIEKMLGA